MAVAKELILTGRRVDAAAALGLGMVGRVVPAADLMAAAAALAAEIAQGGPLAVAQAKRAIDDGFGRPLAEGLAVERAAYEVVLASEDRNEGLAAFAEKRPPSWQGAAESGRAKRRSLGGTQVHGERGRRRRRGQSAPCRQVTWMVPDGCAWRRRARRGAAARGGRSERAGADIAVHEDRTGPRVPGDGRSKVAPGRTGAR